MNELDLLKTHWQKEEDFIKFKQEDIITMIHKSSSSIVKWLLIICSSELLLGLSLSLFPFFIFEIPNELTIEFITNWVFAIAFYIVIIYFIFSFLKLYKSIKSFQSTKLLLDGILAIRKNTDRYIKFNLLWLVVAFINQYVFFLIKERNEIAIWGKIIFISVFLILFFLLIRKLVKLYYKLVYGFLLKKLMINYDHLIAIDSEENS